MKYILILTIIWLSSCLPDTGGKNHQFDEIIHDSNRSLIRSKKEVNKKVKLDSIKVYIESLEDSFTIYNNK